VAQSSYWQILGVNERFNIDAAKYSISSALKHIYFLKEEQRLALRTFLNRNVFALLLGDFGKHLTNQLA